MKTGIYDFEGNTVIYEGGSYGYDLDSASDIPVMALEVMADYICSLEDFEDY